MPAKKTMGERKKNSTAGVKTERVATSQRGRNRLNLKKSRTPSSCGARKVLSDRSNCQILITVGIVATAPF
jgi:hypothetical protein